MRRLLVSCLTAVLGLSALTATAPASGGIPTDDRPFPGRIELPDGFQPEGIAIGRGARAWLGSLADGDIYEVSLRTGTGQVISQGLGTASVGLKHDRRGRLFVAGGPSGTARVVDIDTGTVQVSYPLSAGTSFVNDVLLTTRAAWFTDSFQAQLYRVARDGDGAPGAFTTLPLTGDWVQGDGFQANGISTTPTGKALLVVNSRSGLLFRVDPATGAATEVDLGGDELTGGDGLLRHGRILYVVRGSANQVAVVRLDRLGTSGEVVRTITSDDFDTPTTVARFGGRLYLPNARFATVPEPTAATEYWVTQVRAKP